MENDIAKLQATYPSFFYDAYAYERQEEGIILSYTLSAGEHHFSPKIFIQGVTREMVERVGEERMNAWAFTLGLAEIPTYWKAFVSPEIEIRCGHLDSEQIKFWQKLIYHGMGEFFYQNKIDPFFPNVICESNGIPRLHTVARDDVIAGNLQPTSYNLQPVLVPVGGGKDSIVTLELLAKEDAKITTFSGHLGASPAVIDTFHEHHPSSHAGDIVFSRTIDPHLLELNQLGHPNGHTPFSSVLAFLSTFTAELFAIPRIALSNEASSSEASGTWNGIDINHQYSKSDEFEKDFRAYIAHTLGEHTPRYFSYLREKSELAIMEQFVQYREYFPVFHSCNVGQKTNTWCGSCGKCAFVALLLAAYLDDETIARIFGRDILAEETLRPHINALLGKTEFKPFECVGTREESREALRLALDRRKGSVPKLLRPYV